MTDDPASTLLSPAESAILVLVATGATNREVARERGITEATVKKHLTNINTKLGTGNRTEAFRRALEMGLIEVRREDAAADGITADLTRRLAEELELARRRSRQVGRWAAAGLTVAAVGVVAAWFWLGRGVDRAGIDVSSPPPATASVAQRPLWVPSKSLPTPRGGMALVALGDEVFAIGGQAEDGAGTGTRARARALDETLRFGQPTSPDWVPVSDKPTAVGDIGAVEIGGEILVPGGCDAAGRATDRVDVYDPAADVWRRAAPLPGPRCGYGLVALQGKAYLFGGRTGDDPASALDEVLVYDPGTDAWTVSEARLPDRRSDLGAAVFARENRIHLLGGRDRSGNPERNHWVFKPFDTRDPWETDLAAPLPNGRAGHAIAAVPAPFERIYIVGGGWDTRVSPSALELDLESDSPTWQTASDLVGPTPLRGAAMVHHGRRLLVAGGYTDDALSARTYFLEPFSSIYLLSP